MASVTDTAKPEARPEAKPRLGRMGLGRIGPARGRRRREATPPSRIGRLIVILNLTGLAILIGGALLLNELRQGLVTARIESLHNEGQVIANVIEKNATRGDPEPLLVVDT